MVGFGFPTTTCHAPIGVGAGGDPLTGAVTPSYLSSYISMLIRAEPYPTTFVHPTDLLQPLEVR